MKKPSLSGWFPTGAPPSIALAFHMTLLSMMMVRGMDYGVGEEPLSARRLGSVEAAAPLWLWGTLFAAASAIGFISLAWRAWVGVVWAHTAGAALYAAIGAGVAWDVVLRGAETDLHISWVLLVPAITLAAIITALTRRKRLPSVVLAVTVVAITTGLATIHLDGLRNATVLIGVAALNALCAINMANEVLVDQIIRQREGPLNATAKR